MKVNHNESIKENERNMDKMKKVYESILNDQKLKNHININRDDRIKFIRDYPYDNLPHNDKFQFNNICMFNDLSSANGYIIIDDNLKIIDFNGNYKLTENINISQRCLLPENLFYQKYDYRIPINPLDKTKVQNLLK